MYFSPDVEATTKDDLISDRIARDAEEAAENTLPPQRGQLKKMVLAKKSLQAEPHTMQCDMGFLKMVLARDKSYIVRWCAKSKKWPLIVICEWANHAEVMHRLWEEAETRGMTKAKLVEKKNKMKSTLATAKKPSMNTMTKATTQTGEIDKSGLATMASRLRSDGAVDNDEDDTGDVSASMLPPWWNDVLD